MDKPSDRDRENQALRERLSRMSEASLRINESLEFDTVLQGVLDSARDLTRARYGAIILLDDDGRAEDVLSSGLTPEEAERLWNVPNAEWFFERLGRIPGQFRLPDLPGWLGSQGLAEPGLPVSAGPFHLPQLSVFGGLGFKERNKRHARRDQVETLSHLRCQRLGRYGVKPGDCIEILKGPNGFSRRSR